MPLTDIAIRKLRPKDRPYKVADERGLYLQVTEAGGKIWRFKFRYHGKEKTLTIGRYPEISLAEARDKREEARRMLAHQVDPAEQKQSVKRERKLAVGNTFAAIAQLWWERWRSGRSPNHTESVMRRLRTDVFPVIGARPIQDIKTREVVHMVELMESRDVPELAKRALQTCKQIYRHAILLGVTETSPIEHLRPREVLKAYYPAKHYARVDLRDLPELLRKIDVYRGNPRTRLAMRLLALTFVRTGELINARWEEFDLKKREWRIPASRMKMKSDHIVPLASQTIEVLRMLQAVEDGVNDRPILFPGERDHSKPMSNNTILAALARMGYKGRMTGHGFRGIASTALHELGYPHAHIELQLAHMERDAISAAYNYAQHLPERRKMMQAWADHLDRQRRSI